MFLPVKLFVVMYQAGKTPNNKEKKDVISKAERKRQKDLEKIQSMNNDLNSGIKSLF